MRDVADVVAWLAAKPTVNGVFNLGSGKARSFKDLADGGLPPRATASPTSSTSTRRRRSRGHYQYFTQADMSGLRAAGYTAPLTGLEDGIADYVTRYLATADPYR